MVTVDLSDHGFDAATVFNVLIKSDICSDFFHSI